MTSPARAPAPGSPGPRRSRPPYRSCHGRRGRARTRCAYPSATRRARSRPPASGGATGCTEPDRTAGPAAVRTCQPNAFPRVRPCIGNHAAVRRICRLRSPREEVTRTSRNVGDPYEDIVDQNVRALLVDLVGVERQQTVAAREGRPRRRCDGEHDYESDKRKAHRKRDCTCPLPALASRALAASAGRQGPEVGDRPVAHRASPVLELWEAAASRSVLLPCKAGAEGWKVKSADDHREEPRPAATAFVHFGSPCPWRYRFCPQSDSATWAARLVAGLGIPGSAPTEVAAIRRSALRMRGRAVPRFCRAVRG